MKSLIHKSSPVVLAIFLLGFFASPALMGCADQTSDTGGTIPIPSGDDDDDGDGEEPEESYTAGPLDGSWELSWTADNEIFAEFEIEHDLDERVLRIAFISPDHGHEGTVPVSTWQNERFTAQWEPYTDQEYTITQSSFVEGSTTRIEGLMRATTFDFRPFVMVKID